MVKNDLLAENGEDYEILRYAPRNQTKRMVEEAKEKQRVRMSNWREEQARRKSGEKASKKGSGNDIVTRDSGGDERSTNGVRAPLVPTSTSTLRSSLSLSSGEEHEKGARLFELGEPGIPRDRKDDQQAVFDAWVLARQRRYPETRGHRPRLDSARRGAVDAALKIGYSVDELKLAVAGFVQDATRDRSDTRGFLWALQDANAIDDGIDRANAVRASGPRLVAKTPSPPAPMAADANGEPPAGGAVQ